jgi:hypothetical protein
VTRFRGQLLNLAVWLFTKFTIMMSNVPGPATQQYFAGQPLTDLYYFLFVPLGVYVGTLSYNGKVCVGPFVIQG